MRSDGEYTFFRVQHLDSRDRWVDSAIAHLLFKNLNFEQKRGKTGDYYRELLRPCSASTDLWQQSGLDGFEGFADARAALAAVRGENPDMRFRIVRIVQTKVSEVVG